MGASGWHYLVPYRDDVAQALEELRHTVYNSGDFYREDPDPAHTLTEEQFIAQLDPADDDLGINEFLLDQWREAQQRPRPVDPDTLFQSQPHSGTHSIIDMARGGRHAAQHVHRLTPDPAATTGVIRDHHTHPPANTHLGRTQ
ncbi:hypothetical protein Pa4123_55530 [Phytohabitans aurantiacus]|uniref:Uncharacterized protein n=1 Tax=Phytohabitans aurantiacus TaxID=3016789 RepID=A0ABQ5R255_9ACTN|nr:hypothetical protein Pa4123_55530 [Phytohabitans aurantiacus]